MKLPDLLRFPQRDTRYPFIFLLLTAFLALAWAVYYYFTGPDQALPWQMAADLQPVTLPASRFEVLLQAVDIRVKGYLITQRFEVGLPVIDTAAAAGLVLFMGICFTFYLAVVSTFRQMAFYVGMLLWMVFLSSLNLDLLGIFTGTRQYLLMLTLVVTGGTAFLFQAFLTRVSLPWRLGVFGLLVGGLGVYLATASPLTPAHTALHLASYGSLGCLAAAAIFIFWVAYENIHGLLWFNTQSREPGRRFPRWQFVVIGILYLLSLLMLYLNNARILSLDITFLNAFLILLVSALVGFWGTWRREVHYRQYFTFENGAAFLYLTLAIITAVSIGFAFANANDSYIRAYTDFLVFTHLAFGAVFFLYILINFGPLLQQKLRVYKVVYDPKLFPFFSVIILGTLLVAVLVIRSNYMLPRKALSGYYNALGDFYKETGDLLLAERFYGEGEAELPNNLKSTSALAALNNERLYLQNEIKYLQKAIETYPTDKMFLRLANKYPEREQLFDQLFVLQQGVKKFPGSAPLLNNLALLYGSTGLGDSADYFFDQAQKHLRNPEVILANRFAYYLQTGQARQAGKLAGSVGDLTYLPLQNNLLLLQNFNRVKLLDNPVELPAGKILKPEEFALVYHAALQGQALSDRHMLQQLDRYLSHDQNLPYRFDLSVAKAFVQQRLGRQMAARTTLENLAATEPEYAGYLLDLIGLQLMQAKHYQAAAAHFEQARVKNWPEAGLHLLHALAFLPDKQVETLMEAGQLQNSPDKTLAARGRELLWLLQANPTQIVTQASDSLKVQYLQLNQHPNRITDQEYLAIASTVQDRGLKILAQQELATFYVGLGNLPAATAVIQTLLPQLTQKNQTLSTLNLLQAEILLQLNQTDDLIQALSRMYLAGPDLPKKNYYLARVAQKRNQTASAKKYYDLAVQSSPGHGPTVLAAADYYAKKLRQPTQAYDLLLNSITYDPYNPEVFKAYILQSVAIGYADFAASALEDLAKLVSPAEYQAFQETYREARAKREASMKLKG